MTDTEKELMYVKRRLNEACCEREQIPGRTGDFDTEDQTVQTDD